MDSIKNISNEKPELSWLEGLLLLIVILVVILVGSFSNKANIKLIWDEPVSMSESIDNLK